MPTINPTDDKWILLLGSLDSSVTWAAVCSASDSGARGPEFDICSGYILWFLLLPIEDGQLLAKVSARSTG